MNRLLKSFAGRLCRIESGGILHLSGMKRSLSIALLLVIAGTSCKSLKTLSAKDSSANNTTAKKTVKKDRDVKFIDDIEVTPGSVVTSRHKTINTNPKKSTAKKPEVSYTNPNTNLSKSNIENANALQLKYAVMLDATVEKLTNVALLQTIDQWWGTKYCMGGSTANCIDCSAFTQTLFRDVYNMTIPRTAQEQYNGTDRVEMEDLQEGDLVFFHTSGKKEITHVGFYMLNNKFVHAATSGGVMISDLNDSYWRGKYRGGGRVHAAGTASN